MILTPVMIQSYSQVRSTARDSCCRRSQFGIRRRRHCVVGTRLALAGCRPVFVWWRPVRREEPTSFEEESCISTVVRCKDCEYDKNACPLVFHFTKIIIMDPNKNALKSVGYQTQNKTGSSDMTISLSLERDLLHVPPT